MLSYLRNHIVRPNAYHIGNFGRGAERTRKEDGLRDRLENFLDELVRKGPGGQAAGLIRQKVQAFVRSEPALAWATNPNPRQTALEWLQPRLKLALLALLAFLLLPILIPPVIIWALVLRYKEQRDPAPD